MVVSQCLSCIGILDAPSNLASSAMNDSVLITWTPPSTLPGTTMSFRVNASVGDQSEIFTTSQHNFLIGLCDLGVSSCYSNCELSVFVRSINQVGEGEPAYTTISIQLFSCDGAKNGINAVNNKLQAKCPFRVILHSHV